MPPTVSLDAIPVDTYTGSVPVGIDVDHPVGAVSATVLKLKLPPVGVEGAFEALLNTLSKATLLPSVPSIPLTPLVFRSQQSLQETTK